MSQETVNTAQLERLEERVRQLELLRCKDLEYLEKKIERGIMRLHLAEPLVISATRAEEVHGV